MIVVTIARSAKTFHVRGPIVLLAIFEWRTMPHGGNQSSHRWTEQKPTYL